MKENDNQEEFKNLAPKLKHLLDQEREQASLPKDYFQNFEARLQQRLATEQSLEPNLAPKNESKWSSWWQSIWKPLTALAIPALLVFFWWRQLPDPQMPEQTNFLALSTQEIDQYIAQNLDQFSLGDLMAMADPEVLDNWQDGIMPTLPVEPVVEPEPEPIPPSQAKKESSLDKALEATENEDLLDELTSEDLNLEDDWF